MFFAVTLAASIHLGKAEAATSSNLNFQARLMTSGGAIVPDGYYNIEFKIYNASTSSGSSQGSCSGDAACQWVETYYDSNGATAGNDNRLRVKNGYVTANLGTLNALPNIDWSQELWLTMRVGGSAQSASPTYDAEMSPRLKLTALPYAFQAGTANNANALGGLAASGFIQNTTSPQASSNFNISGTGTAGTSLLTPLLDTASGIALNIGTNNATAINLNKDTAVAAGKSLTLAAGTGTFNQTYNATSAGSAQTLTLSNTSGTNTDGLYINRNGASGTTTNGINVTNTAGTLTNGLSFNGTIGTDINRSSGTLSLNGAGGINLQSNGTTTASLSSTGAASFQNSTDSANGFQVKQSSGAGGAAVVNVDTAGSNIQLLGNNAATLSTWTTTTAMTVGSAGTGQQRVRGGAVAANGYLYQVGGNDGASTTLTTVQYAKINADGTVGTWASTTALPATRRQTQPVVANGYIYLIGGRDSGGTVAATSYYAKLNNDGTIGTWNTTTALTSGAGARFGQATVVYNGYVFSIGGFDASIATTNGVYYNKINPDGSLGSTWTSTGANLPSNLTNINNGVVANGYVYLAGGYNGTTVDNIYYAKLNSDGTTGSWSTQSGKLSVANENMALYVANGYLYTVGGDYGLAVQAFPLGATGAVGTGITLTALPGALGSIAGEVSTAQANGYFYLIGGSGSADGSGTARNTVYYASTPRVQVGGGLDLVGYSGENLNEGGSGGNLTAGNTAIVGTLQVQGSANFSNGLGVTGNLTVTGGASIRAGVNATNTFQVQNASGNEIITVDTSGNQVNLGKASTVDAKMVFYNASNANTVTIQTGVTSGSYSLTLPTAIGSTGQCLAAGTVASGNVPLTFTACGSGGVTSVGAIGSATANGASITGSTLNLAAADATNGGVITNTTQTLAGDKNFTYSNAGAGSALTATATNTSSTQTNGILFNRNGASGTTTNGINITNTAGTLTNGLNFSGTIGTLINSSVFTVSGTGAIVGVGVNSGSGLLQGTGGLTLTGTTSINASTNSATSINTGSSNALVSIGGGSGTFALDTTNIDISNTGAITGVTGVTLASGNFLQNGSGTFDTGTGAVSLKGDTTVAAGKNLSLAAGAGTFTQSFNTAGAGTAHTTTLSNTSGTQTNGILVDRNGASGTTTNGINITNTAGTLTNGLNFSGTIGTLINSSVFTVSGAGAIVGVGLNAGTGLIQGTGGLTVTGTTSINNNTNSATSINTGSSNALVSIGGGSGTFALDTTNIDISNTGAITGATGVTLASGNFLQTGSGTFDTGTGAVSLKGDTTISAGKSLSLAAGAGTFTQSFNTAGAGTAHTTTLSNTSGTQTNGMLVDRNGASGTTTNGINITNTAGTLTNGLSFTGTIGTDINRGTGTLSLNGASGITLQNAGSTIATVSSTGLAVTGVVNASTNLQTANTTRIDNTGALSNVTASTSILTSGTLGLARGGTNNTTFTTNGVIYSDGTSLVSTAAGTAGQCLKSNGSGSAPTYGTCGVGASTTMQDTYDASPTAASGNPAIQLAATNGGIRIRDASSTVGDLFTLQNSAGTVKYFNVTASGISLQNATAAAFDFSISTGHLKIYNPSDVNKYADIYYDNTNNEAVFAASSGNTTRVGGGAGNIAIALGTSGSATNISDVLTFNKVGTLSTTYSLNDFTVTRNLVSGSNSEGGSVLKVESTGSGSGTVNPTLLLVNQSNSSATGNLISAQKAGSNVFTVGSAGSVSIASGQAYTGLGAVNINSASATNLTLSAGTTGAVIVKAATNSSNSFQIQDSSSAVILSADSTNGNIQIGSATTDAVDNLLILDSYNQASDPTGIEGAMYYNTSSFSFRCYMNGRWRSCVSGVVFANTSVPAGNTVTSTSETNFTSNYTIPANDCQPGRVYRVTAQGVLTSTGTTGTLNIKVKLGSTILATTGAQTQSVAATGREWRVEFQMICVTTGGSGTVEAGGTFTRFTSSAIVSVLSEMSNAAAVTVDTTTSQALQISAQWNTASQSITMRQLIIEASGP